jgi:hypothetical protein
MTRIPTIIYALAISVTLALPGAALAQAVIDGEQVSPEDLPKIRSQCRALAGRENVSLTGDGEDLIEPSPDPASAWPRGANSMDNALTRFDLNRLTYAKCRAAGLV